MPTYDFKCNFCGFVFEQFKKIKDLCDEGKCPQCGMSCKRLISGGTGFLLKGEDWYKKSPSEKEKIGNKNEQK